jgi:FeS assembly SUF system regulator
MIRMTKQTDYGFVLLSHLAQAPERVVNAPDLAAETRLPVPMVSKILKLLARHELLRSHRGVKGGYSLARPAADLTAAEIVRALEGPVALTVCIEGTPGECDREAYCQVRGHWQAINVAVDTALGQVTLEQLAMPGGARLVQLGRSGPGRGVELSS